MNVEGEHLERIFLEQWLHDTIRRKVKLEPEYRQFVGRESISNVTRDDIDRYHLFKLRKILAYAYEKSAFYRRLFDAQSIRPDHVKSLGDLARIPFTDPSDLAQHPYELLCVSLGEVERATTFTSSGTTGPQKKVFCTEGDLETMTDFMAAGIRAVAEPGDVVQIMLPSARPNDQADLLAKGVSKMGGVPVITGTLPTSEDQIRTIEKYHSTVLFAATSRLYRITQEARREHDLSSKGVKALFTTSEYLSDSMRNLLREVWRCDVHTHYGMTEMGLGVAVECHAHQGFHFNEADLLLEVVDPRTGEVLGDDEEGELVFTTLTREAMPIIRYRTHDISRLVGRPCECGVSTLKKIATVTRRLEGIVRLAEGDEIYPSTFDELIFGTPEVIDYKLILRRAAAKEILVVEAEVLDQSQAIRESVGRAILAHPAVHKAVERGSMSLPRIELVSPGELRRATRAKKLIIDERY